MINIYYYNIHMIIQYIIIDFFKSIMSQNIDILDKKIGIINIFTSSLPFFIYGNLKGFSIYVNY